MEERQSETLWYKKTDRGGRVRRDDGEKRRQGGNFNPHKIQNPEEINIRVSLNANGSNNPLFLYRKFNLNLKSKKNDVCKYKICICVNK